MSAEPPLPLLSLLSQALVAFTIELDNEFEHRTPNFTTDGSGGDLVNGVWLCSAAMYLNCMRYVDERGVAVKELEKLARTTPNLSGMERWRYVRISDKIVRATSKGLRSRSVWQPLFPEIEERWKSRFGRRAIDRLRKALLAAIPTDNCLPDCMPILGYGMFSRLLKNPAAAAEPDSSLLALLSKVLLAFAVEFETSFPISMAIGSNVMRVLNEDGVRARDLTRLSGVAKMAIDGSLSFLRARGLAIVESNPRSRSTESPNEKPNQKPREKIVRLTPKGVSAQVAYQLRLAEFESGWHHPELRKSLESVAEDLFRGLEPYPGGWRASVPKPEILPHFPMVCHRGGYPDGS